MNSYKILFIFILLFFLPGSAKAAAIEDSLLYAIEMEEFGLINEAKKAYEEILLKDPDNVLAKMRIAHLVFLENGVEKAIEQYTAILETHPDCTGASLAKAALLMLEGHNDEAKKLLVTLGEHPDALILLAHLALDGAESGEEGKKEAIALARRAQAAGADDSSVRYRLAELFEELGLLKLARFELESALEISPYDPYILSRLGQLLLRMGEATTALNAWRGALALNPKNVQARSSLAAALRDLAVQAKKNNKISDFNRLMVEALEYEPTIREGLTETAPKEKNANNAASITDSQEKLSVKPTEKEQNRKIKKRRKNRR